MRQRPILAFFGGMGRTRRNRGRRIACELRSQVRPYPGTPGIRGAGSKGRTFPAVFRRAREADGSRLRAGAPRRTVAAIFTLATGRKGPHAGPPAEYNSPQRGE